VQEAVSHAWHQWALLDGCFTETPLGRKSSMVSEQMLIIKTKYFCSNASAGREFADYRI
jgi:hypothetical protein